MPRIIIRDPDPLSPLLEMYGVEYTPEFNQAAPTFAQVHKYDSGPGNNHNPGLWYERNQGVCFVFNKRWNGTQWVKTTTPEQSWRIDLGSLRTRGLGITWDLDTSAASPEDEFRPDGTAGTFAAAELEAPSIDAVRAPQLKFQYPDRSGAPRNVAAFAPATMASYNMVVAWAEFEVVGGTPTINESYGVSSAVVAGGGFQLNLTLSDAMVHTDYGTVFGLGGPSTHHMGLVGSRTTTVVPIGWYNSAGAALDISANTVSGSLIVIGQQA